MPKDVFAFSLFAGAYSFLRRVTRRRLFRVQIPLLLNPRFRPSIPILLSIPIYTIPMRLRRGWFLKMVFFMKVPDNTVLQRFARLCLPQAQFWRRKALRPIFFGEGIAIFGDRLYQLTWKSGICFVYDKNTFELQVQFTYSTEGWGLTHDGEKLIMSDGTNIIYFRDPNTFREIGRIEVTDSTGPVHYLNELEYIKGQIFANVWQTDRIACIDPKSGRITGWINLAGILPQTDRLHHRVGVLNGIAYDAATDRIFVTGKWWPKLFEIKLVQ